MASDIFREVPVDDDAEDDIDALPTDYQSVKKRIKDSIEVLEDKIIATCPYPGCDWTYEKTIMNPDMIETSDIPGVKMTIGRHLATHYSPTERPQKQRHRKNERVPRQPREPDFVPAKPYDDSKPLTLEEEMNKEMYDTLADLLKKVPGSRNVNWILDSFTRNSRLREDPQALGDFLRRQCPKMDRGDLQTIIDAVFDVREQYMDALSNVERFDSYHSPTPRRQGFSLGYGHSGYSDTYGRRQPPIPTTPSSYSPTFRRQSDGTLTFEDVMAIIDERERQRMEYEERQRLFERLAEIERTTTERMLEMQRELQSQFLSAIEALTENKDKSDPVEVKLEELRAQMRQKELEYQQQIMQMKDEQVKLAIEKLEKAQQMLVAEAEKRVRESRSKIGDFESDDVRLVATGLENVSDILKSGLESRRQLAMSLIGLGQSMINGTPPNVQDVEKDEDLPDVVEYIDDDDIVDEE